MNDLVFNDRSKLFRSAIGLTLLALSLSACTDLEELTNAVSSRIDPAPSPTPSVVPSPGPSPSGTSSPSPVSRLRIISPTEGSVPSSSYQVYFGECEATLPLSIHPGVGVEIKAQECNAQGTLRVLAAFTGLAGSRNIAFTQLSTVVQRSITLAGAVRRVGPGHSNATLQSALAIAGDGDIVALEEGSYIESGQIELNHDVTIEGLPTSDTVIRAAAGFPYTTADAGAWVLVKPGKTVILRNLTFDGQGKKIRMGVLSRGTSTVEGCTFRNIGHDQDRGTALTFYHSGVVRNNHFSNITRVGVWVEDLLPSDGQSVRVDVSGNAYVGKGPGDWVDYFLMVTASAEAVATSNRTEAMLGNLGGTAPSVPYYSWEGHLVLEDNVIGPVPSGSAGVYVYGTSPTQTVRLTRNSFADPSFATLGHDAVWSEMRSGNIVDARANWWGSATGPTAVTNPLGMGARVTDGVDFAGWLTQSP